MIRCYTLIDITSTGFTKRPTTPADSIKRNQQRNYETFLQLISLRSQPTIAHPPIKLENVDITQYKFGSYYLADIFTYHVWYFDFESEHVDSFSTTTSPVGSLVNDFVNVPVIGNLTETAKINSVINTLGNKRNTYFEVI